MICNFPIGDGENPPSVLQTKQFDSVTIFQISR